MGKDTSINIVSDGIGWVLDAIKTDFTLNTRHVVSSTGDINWILNWWALGYYTHKKNIVAHLHHVDRSQIQKYNFSLINHAKACIVPNKITQEIVQNKVSVPVVRLPYWILSPFTHKVNDKSRINSIRGDKNKLVIGSFQKDTETVSKKPKLVKGPDTFINIVEKINKIKPVKVVLSGFERSFVIDNLKRLQIEYVYFERDKNISDLYESLDWYFVTSRDEGGPQAAIECCYKKVKILSTNVGVCPEILHPDCICNNENDFIDKVFSDCDHREFNYDNIKRYLPESVIPKYDHFFESLS
jgi:hypothetical protein